MFYTQKLGFKEKLFMPEMKLAIVVSPEDTEGTTLLLEPRGNLGSDIFFDGIYDAGMPVIVFGVKDVEAEFERLKDKASYSSRRRRKQNGARRRSLTIRAVISFRSIRRNGKLATARVSAYNLALCQLE